MHKILLSVAINEESLTSPAMHFHHFDENAVPFFSLQFFILSIRSTSFPLSFPKQCNY